MMPIDAPTCWSVRPESRWELILARVGCTCCTVVRRVWTGCCAASTRHLSACPAAPGPGAGFGSAVAAETSSTIVVGAPGRDVAGAADAGRVVRLDYLSDTTPVVSAVEQGRGGFSPESGDRFGEVVHVFGTGEGAVAIIGVPGEDVGTQVDAGAVAAMPRTGPLSMVTQDSPGAAGAAEAGDGYGSAVDSYCTFIVDHPSCIVAIGGFR